jgi:hypothetical protein
MAPTRPVVLKRMWKLSIPVRRERFWARGPGHPHLERDRADPPHLSDDRAADVEALRAEVLPEQPRRDGPAQLAGPPAGVFGGVGVDRLVCAAVVGTELAVTGQAGGGDLHGSVDGLLVDRGLVEVTGANAVNDADGQQPRRACHGVGVGEAVAEIHRLRARAASMRRCAGQVRMCPSTALRRASQSRSAGLGGRTRPLSLLTPITVRTSQA